MLMGSLAQTGLPQTTTSTYYVPGIQPPGRLKWSYNPFIIHTLTDARPPPIIKRCLELQLVCIWPGLQLGHITLTSIVQPLRATSFESAQHKHWFALVVPVLLSWLTLTCLDLLKDRLVACLATVVHTLTFLPLVLGLLQPGLPLAHSVFSRGQFLMSFRPRNLSKDNFLFDTAD